MTRSARESGDIAEQLALELLQQSGLTLLEKNYHCRGGEIDLLMAETDLLGRPKVIVVVEVRFRRSEQFGTSAETVTIAKQQKIILAAQHFMVKQPRLAERPWRFDVVAMSGQLDCHPEINWIKDAFRPD